MNAIFKKLNYKDQQVIHILQAPESFHPTMQEMRALTLVKTELATEEAATFILAFVMKQSEIDALAPLFSSALQGDGILWYAYPKGTSKRYKCDFNRDTGWEIVGKFGFEAVRQVAMDEEWSALRFRRVKYIKTMTRSRKLAITEDGQKRVKK